MPVIGSTVTLATDTPTLIASGRHVDDPITVVVSNTSADDACYLGGFDVDSTGFPLLNGSLSFVLGAGDHLYAIGAAAIDIHVLVNRQ